MRKSIDIAIEPGAVLRAYSSAESKQLAARWLSTFGGSGAPDTKSYLWHVFSFQAYPSLSGQEARTEYDLQVAPRFVILSNDRDQAVETDVRPTTCSESDFLIFPPNMAWTMAFTHEDGWLGPYFAKHSQYSKLNQENIDQIAKAQAIEQARQKGWL